MLDLLEEGDAPAPAPERRPDLPVRPSVDSTRVLSRAERAAACNGSTSRLPTASRASMPTAWTDVLEIAHHLVKAGPGGSTGRRREVRPSRRRSGLCACLPGVKPRTTTRRHCQRPPPVGLCRTESGPISTIGRGSHLLRSRCRPLPASLQGSHRDLPTRRRRSGSCPGPHGENKDTIHAGHCPVRHRGGHQAARGRPRRRSAIESPACEAHPGRDRRGLPKWPPGGEGEGSGPASFGDRAGARGRPAQRLCQSCSALAHINDLHVVEALEGWENALVYARRADDVIREGWALRSIPLSRSPCSATERNRGGRHPSV